MSSRLSSLILAASVLGLMFPNALADAHVPYLEDRDFTTSSPFVCPSAEQSIAVYSWLESSSDVDYYRVKVTTGTLFYAGVIVPVFDQYAAFRPCFALIGPGLPHTTESLPTKLPSGWGAVIIRESEGKPRKQFYEPFGGKSYYQGPEMTMRLQAGEYTLIYWDPNKRMGDYVAIIGKREIWGARDTVRGLRVTPVIRRGGELHLGRTKK